MEDESGATEAQDDRCRQGPAGQDEEGVAHSPLGERALGTGAVSSEPACIHRHGYAFGMTHRPCHEGRYRRPSAHQRAQQGERGSRAAQGMSLLDDSVIAGETLPEADGRHTRVGDAIGHAQMMDHRPRQFPGSGEQPGQQKQRQ